MKATSTKYIAAFLYQRLLSIIVVYLAMFAQMLVQYKLTGIWLALSLHSLGAIPVVISYALFKYVYNGFPELNMRKVMPYFYASNVISIIFLFMRYDVKSALLATAYSLVLLYFQRAYFINKKERWY